MNAFMGELRRKVDRGMSGAHERLDQRELASQIRMSKNPTFEEKEHDEDSEPEEVILRRETSVQNNCKGNLRSIKM